MSEIRFGTTRVAAAMVLACAWCLGLASPAQAEAPRLRRIVVHVDRQTDVPAWLLARAEELAGNVFDAIGVHLVWTGGKARSAPPDGALHLDVVISTTDRAGRSDPNAASLGRAAHGTGRAYIFYSRILSFARRTGNPTTLVFANVLAHELGHMLLPPESHSASGLMQPQLNVRIARMPDFTPDQKRQIRLVLQAGQESSGG